MASPTVARRAPRTALESDDAVMLRAAELAAWAKKNVRTVMYALGGAAVLVLGFFYYQFNETQRADRAAKDFLALQSTISNDTAAALRQFDQFAQNHPGTDEAAQSRMLAAQLWMAKGNTAKAIEDARSVADGKTALRNDGRLLLGAALGAAGKRQEAESTYLSLADDAKLLYQKQDALSQAALLREQANDWKGAAELYRRILDTTEKGTADRVSVQMHLAEAEAHAGLPITAGN
jgi:hypothetical protein